MTNEQAIEILKAHHMWTGEPQEIIDVRKENKALEMAIQALSQEPTSEKELNKAYTFGHNKGVKAYYNEQLCTVELPEAVFEYILSLVPTEETEQEPCDDAISREDAFEIIASNDATDGTEPIFTGRQVVALLSTLPSVTQKSGKWIRWREEVQRGTHYTENIPHCKCSECDTEYDIFASRFINYCPNCGCRMVEPQESEDKE